MSFAYNITLKNKICHNTYQCLTRLYKLYLPTFNPFTICCHSKLLTIHSIKLSLGKSLSSTTMVFIVSHRFIARSTSTINDTNQSPGLPGRKKSTCIRSFAKALTQIPGTDGKSGADAHLAFFVSPYTVFPCEGASPNAD